MAPKVIVDHYKTKRERADARKAIGRLGDQRVKPTTLKRYRYAAAHFTAWLELWKFRLALTFEEMDQQLIFYIENLWEEGEAKGLAGDTLSGICHLLCTRRQFPGAWQRLGVWQRVEMPARAPPITAVMALAAAEQFRRRGDVAMAALMLLGFHCFLRTGELLSVCVEHLAFTAAGTGILALPLTKSGQRKGSQESVTIDDPLCAFWVSLAAQKQRKGRICQLSGPAFRAAFYALLRELGLGHMMKPSRSGAAAPLATGRPTKASSIPCCADAGQTDCQQSQCSTWSRSS